uniref:hypothetical protein n=1 Tax=Catenulispora pinisilvae TaxID=2705253 RepID=UPI001E359801
VDSESRLHKKPSAHNEMSAKKAAEIGAEVRFTPMLILIPEVGQSSATRAWAARARAVATTIATVATAASAASP